MLSRSVVPGLWFALAVLVAACAGHDTASSRDATDARFAAAHGTSLLDPKGLGAFVIQGDEKRVAVSTVAVTGQPFTQALHAEIKVPSGTDYSVQVAARTVAPVAKGDAVLASFFVRALPGPERDAPPESALVFERAGDPYTKSLNYTFKVGPAWRQVRIPFVVAEDYPAGGAQIIFRLGYDPEILEFGGVVVDNYGKQVTTREMPRTDGADWALATELGKAYADKPVVITDGGAANIEVDPGTVIGPISPYVYGINAQRLGAVNTTIRRMGGNRQTGYNWELNASNAGADYRHISDQWPCTVQGFSDCDRPGAQILDFARADHDAGVETIMTLPMVDYVTADTKGAVPESQAAPSPRWVKSLPKKGAPFVEQPDLGDGVVYQDELVNLLVKRLGRADAGGVRFYALDNEPALWPSTHPRIHPAKTTYQEMSERSEATADAVLAVDPSAQILGAVMFGWSEYMSLNTAPDAATYDAKYGNYVTYFLESMKALEAKHKRRLVHALDVHWYPEMRGAKRITEPDTSRKTVDARLAAPRSLWDPTFNENTWITDQLGKPIRLLPWLKELVAAHYPGTKLAMTEYNFGAGQHISGGLAQADVLGILGREGVYIANYWGEGAAVGELPPYIAGAFRLYRNYDGKQSTFGDTAVGATTDDVAKLSVHAATDSKHPDVLTVLVINKTQTTRFTGKIHLAGKTTFARATSYTLAAGSPELKPGAAVTVADNTITATLEPLSATLFVCAPR